ncbi:MAG: transglycosylase SLT domain-containing protein [Rhizobacter sp.]
MEEHVLIPTHRSNIGRFLTPIGLAALLVALSACSTPPTTAPAAPAPVSVATADIHAQAPAPSDIDKTKSAAADAPDPIASLAAGQPIDDLRPDVKVNLDDKAAQEVARKDLWQRLRAGLVMPDLDTDLVRQQEQWYASRPDYVQRMTTRGGRYLFHIVEEVERRGMPSDLALLPFIESAFNPQAISSAKASGIWQFMPATGKDFDLKQNMFRDDRRDVLASTRAALDYLQQLHGMFGDWHLALAAYNWGQGNVQRAIKRNQAQGLPTDYLSLKMPLETQHYVPKLQAVKNIIAQPERFKITLPPLENHPYFLAVPIERDIDVELAAKLSSLSVEEFRTLNPQMNKPVILAAATPKLLLPYDNAEEFVRQIKTHKGPLATWTAWVAPSTMRPQEAAQKVGMEVADLRSVNRIPSGMLVKAGSTLLVTRGTHKHDDVSERIADNASITLAADVPAKRRATVKVGAKDTLTSIANRHRVSVAQLREWNQLDAKAKLKTGESLVLFLPNVSGKKSASTRTASASRKNAAPVRKTAVSSGSKRTAAPSTKTTTNKRSTQVAKK